MASIPMEDRIAEYKHCLQQYLKLEERTKEDVYQDHLDELEIAKMKLNQRKERLEALGVVLDG